MKDKAVIVVSHPRLYTVMSSDQIVVLENGQVTARGTLRQTRQPRRSTATLSIPNRWAS